MPLPLLAIARPPSRERTENVCDALLVYGTFQPTDMLRMPPLSRLGIRGRQESLGGHPLELGRDAIELCRYDEVVLMQALDLLGLQRDRGVAPAKSDLGMMSLAFGECSYAFDEAEGFTEILETIGSLDSFRFIK